MRISMAPAFVMQCFALAVLCIAPALAILPAHEADLNHILAASSMRDILDGYEDGTHFAAEDGFESGDNHFNAAKLSRSEAVHRQSSIKLYNIAACAMDKALAMVEIMQPTSAATKLHADSDPEITKHGAPDHGQLVDVLTELPTCCIEKDEHRDKCVTTLEPAFNILHKVFATASKRPEDNEYITSTIPAALIAAFKSTSAAADKLIEASGVTAGDAAKRFLSIARNCVHVDECRHALDSEARPDEL